MILAAFLQSFAEIALVQHAFNGIRVAVCVLVLTAVIKLWKGAVVDRICLFIAIATILIGILTNISPAFIVVAAALIGLVVKGRKGNEA